MTVLNVQEFGAEGDGSTDDTNAIQSAIDAADAGDEVYLPATGGSYVVRGYGRLLDIRPSSSGVRIVGDGEDTRISYGGGNGGRNVFIISVDARNSGLDDFAIENLTIDGGRENIGGSPNVAAGIQVHDPDSGARGNVDIQIRNVKATNCYGNGIDVRCAGTTVERCTAEDNRQHGFGMETGGDPFQDPPVRFERCLAQGNGFGGGYYGIDLSGGRATAENCVSRDNRGAGGTKCSVGTDRMVYRRCRFADNDGHIFQNTAGRGATVLFDDVVATGNDHAMRLAEDGEYRVPSGSELVLSDNGPDNRGALFITDDAVFDAADATLWINNQSGGPGIQAASSAPGSRVGTYNHADNERGAIGSDSNISFGSQVTDTKRDLGSVPTADQVGAWSNGELDEPDDEEEEEQTSDDDTSSDESEFEEWTPRWDSDTDDWGVIADSDFTGGHALQFENPRSERSRQALSWDTVGEPSDVEIVDRFRVPAFNETDGFGYYARTYLRSAVENGSEVGYWVEMEADAEGFRLAKYRADGGLTTMRRFGSSVEGEFMYRRFRAEGDQLKVKVWPAGDSEPSGWDIEVTDTDHESGWVGVGSYDAEAVETDVFSVATGGETARIAPESDRQTISWTSPTDGEAVAGDVDVRLDVGDVEAARTVEYRVDGETWTEAHYDADTEAFSGRIDTTPFGTGGLTLEARVQDANGDTAGATIDVDVNNDPTVETVEATDVTSEAATLVGELVSHVDEETTVWFEWRAVGDDTWTVAGERTLAEPQRFERTISGLDADTEYEFRAVAEGDGSVTGSTVPFGTLDAPAESSAPSIDAFDVTDQSDDTWSRFEVDWDVSDEERDLDTVVTTLEYQGMTVAAESTDVYGRQASHTHVLRVRGDVDRVHLWVSDTSNETDDAVFDR